MRTPGSNTKISIYHIATYKCDSDMDSDSWQLAAGWREREGRLPNLDVDAFRRAGRYLDTAVLVAYVVLSTTPQLELFGELGILRSCRLSTK